MGLLYTAVMSYGKLMNVSRKDKSTMKGVFLWQRNKIRPRGLCT